MSEPLTVSELRAARRGRSSRRARSGTSRAAPATSGRCARTSRPCAADRLRPRVLVDVEGTTPRRPCSAPSLDAGDRRADGVPADGHPDGEPATARAAAAAGTIMCLSTIATSTPAEVAAAAPDAPRWFQLYVLSRPRRHERARRAGGRVRLQRDRAHRRRAAARPPRARPPHRLPGARGHRSSRASRPRLGGWAGATPPRCSAWIDPTLTWRRSRASSWPTRRSR